MSDVAAFECINEAKVDMDHIYNQSDPRNYYRELNKLDYAIPDTAKPIFQNLIGHLQDRADEPVHVLDLGCSYGVNAAILKYDLSMDDLYEHWAQKQIADATPEEVLAYDQSFLANMDNSDDIVMIGLDQAENAISYATETGLLDDGIVANLETEMLSDDEKDTLGQVDLVISTGCVGYLTEKSFERFMPAVSKGRQPWIANFVLRLFPFDHIEQSLNTCGYATEKLEGETFFQRHFASGDEREDVLGKLCEHGVDPTGKESEGRFVAEFYLSRPAAEVAKIPLEQLLST
ncbi:MAG: hypothetical protein OEX17_02175 [Rhodospirillaceae bacterium]|nr:hypothetical protein [Rhodospirillaceae bacterium]